MTSKLIESKILNKEIYSFLDTVCKAQCNIAFVELCLNDLSEKFTEEFKKYYTYKEKNMAFGIKGTMDLGELVEYINYSQTGHPCILTSIAANNSEDFIERTVTLLLMAQIISSIDEGYKLLGSTLDFICTITKTPITKEKVFSVEEIYFDYALNKIVKKTIYKYELENNQFIQHSTLSKKSIKKLLINGVSTKELEPWVKKEDITDLLYVD